jgi:hypothetical protein
MTMPHFSDVDLLEELYLPGESEAGEHLRACSPCRDRLAALREDLDTIRTGFDRRIAAKPDSFWDAQRASVMAKVQRRRARPVLLRRWALAATLVLAVGGGWLLVDRGAAPRSDPAKPPVASQTTAAEIELPTADPWAADELSGWESAVDWESWLESDQSQRGGA